MMSDPGLASDVGNRFDQVLVDEFQDTNRLQASILLALKPSGVGLTVVAGLATGFSAVCPLRSDGTEQRGPAARLWARQLNSVT